MTAEWTCSNVLISVDAGDRWCVIVKPSSGWVVSSSHLLSIDIHSRLGRNPLTPIVCSCKGMACRTSTPADWIDLDTLWDSHDCAFVRLIDCLHPSERHKSSAPNWEDVARDADAFRPIDTNKKILLNGATFFDLETDSGRMDDRLPTRQVSGSLLVCLGLSWAGQCDSYGNFQCKVLHSF